MQMDMIADIPREGAKSDRISRKVFGSSVALWFLATLVGQWFFAAYVIAYYGSLMVPEGMPGLSNSHIPRNYEPSDPLGNVALAAHVLIASVILIGGPLQLVPQIRLRFPAFHRWTGRLYLTSAIVATLSGFYMIWIRGSAVGDLSQHLGLSLNGVLILVFAFYTVRSAVAGSLVSHRVWALRLFLASSGVWFSRVGLWLWVKLTGGAGLDFASFTGPFLTILNFANYLIPLSVLETYLRVRRGKRPGEQSVFAVFLLVLTALMSIGIYEAANRIWLPKM